MTITIFHVLLFAALYPVTGIIGFILLVLGSKIWPKKILLADQLKDEFKMAVFLGPLYFLAMLLVCCFVAIDA